MVRATLITSAADPEKGALSHSNFYVSHLCIVHQIQLLRIVLFSLRPDKRQTLTTLRRKKQGRLMATYTHNISNDVDLFRPTGEPFAGETGMLPE